MTNDCPVGCETGPLGPKKRADRARDIRLDAARDERCRDLPSHQCNGDEEKFQKDPNFKDRFIASFTKGLPSNDLGEVEPYAYCKLLKALKSGKPGDFKDVPLGCENPMIRRSLDKLRRRWRSIWRGPTRMC